MSDEYVSSLLSPSKFCSFKFLKQIDIEQIINDNEFIIGVRIGLDEERESKQTNKIK